MQQTNLQRPLHGFQAWFFQVFSGRVFSEGLFVSMETGLFKNCSESLHETNRFVCWVLFSLHLFLSFIPQVGFKDLQFGGPVCQVQ